MKLKLLLTACLLVVFSCLFVACSVAPENKPSENGVIVSGQTWSDESGNVIEAHGGQVQKLTYTDRNGKTITKFWWVGENKEQMAGYTEDEYKNNGLKAYSSYDLVHWTSEGVVLRSPENLNDGEDPYFSSLYAPNDKYPNSDFSLAYTILHKSGSICERPKMLYNAKTGLYVLWFHSDDYENGSYYKRAQASVAVSEHPFGPFRLINSFRMYYDADNFITQGTTEYGAVRDMNVFEENEKAYLIYSSDSKYQSVQG